MSQVQESGTRWDGGKGAWDPRGCLLPWSPKGVAWDGYISEPIWGDGKTAWDDRTTTWK